MSDKTPIIWDLGNTLIQTDTLRFAQHIGLIDFALYPLFEWKNPTKIYEIAFDIVGKIKVPHHPAFPHATARGKPMPSLMCHLLAGTIDRTEAQNIVEKELSQWTKDKRFASALQERLVRNTILAIFNPSTFAECMRPTYQSEMIVKACSQKRDATGMRTNELYILSNWDEPSFQFLTKTKRNKRLFSYFKEENIAISGAMGVIKPQPEIYAQFIDTYKLKPENCIFIDDQIENIIAAQSHGMQGIHLSNNNYGDLLNTMKEFEIV